ncbi:MAG: hypothetical protein ABW167_16740 [Baekduia sp.]
MNGLDKFRKWAQRHEDVPIEHGPRQSSLGGRQTTGLKHLREDDASNKERYDRSEAFIHRQRESFPED